MEQFVFPCFRVAFPPLRPPVEVPAACVLKQGVHWLFVVIVAGALKGYNLRIETIFLTHLRARPGGHDVVHLRFPVLVGTVPIAFRIHLPQLLQELIRGRDFLQPDLDPTRDASQQLLLPRLVGERWLKPHEEAVVLIETDLVLFKPASIASSCARSPRMFKVD